MSGDIIKLVPRSPGTAPAKDPALLNQGQVVQSLEELLAEAREGKILGIVVITDRSSEFGYHLNGSAGAQNLNHAIGMVTGVQHRLCAKLWS